MFSVSRARMALTMWNNITRMFSAIPKAMATTNTVFSCPIKGRSVIALTGRSHLAGRISSNPNTLPNINPKKVEKSPATEMIPARFAFFVR